MAFEVSIIGNPNVGKTSLFNIITGTRQYVANWPGVTVEKKIGSFSYKGHNFKLVDLPGIYTLSACSEDERVARDYFLNESPDAVIIVADALNLERSMHLMIQILEMNLPAVLAINSIDEAEEKGRIINPEVISKTFNIPVILTSAKTMKGIPQLLEAIHRTSEQKKFHDINFQYPVEVNEYIETFKSKAAKYPSLSGFDHEWLGIYFLEFGAGSIHTEAELSQSICTSFDMKKLKDIYLNWKYGLIRNLTDMSIVSLGRSWSLRDVLDHVLTHKVLGLLIYLVALFFVFSMTFSIATPLSDLLNLFFSKLSSWAGSVISVPWLKSLVTTGIIEGVGGVLAFIPQIFVLFFFMGFLEESGYLPRAAFLVDKIVRKFGLSGRSFMSIILGFGCNVPAIMSTRTISSTKERLALLLSIPFASCSARLPVYIIIIGAFFPKHAALIMFLLYISSILLVLLSAKLLQVFVTKTDDIPFTIELPRFRLPTAKNLFLYTWEKTEHFLRKASGIILIASILIWFLSYFPSGSDIQNSFAATIGRSFEFLTRHLGWDWHTNTALVFGVAAKEVIVSTYAATLNTDPAALKDALASSMSPQSALALLYFIMAYIPCFATLSAVKLETASYKWAAFTFIYTIFTAYILANIVFFIGGLIL